VLTAKARRGVTLVGILGLVLALMPGGLAAQEQETAPAQEPGQEPAGVEHEFAGFAWMQAGETSTGSVTTRTFAPRYG